MPLRELIISLPQSSGDEYVVAAKCQADDIGFGTVIRYDGGINAFATVNSSIINLMDGRTLDDSYYSFTGRRLGILEKKNARIAVYGYRSAINGCSVVLKLTAEDIADKTEKTMSGYWEYSLEVADKEKLIDYIDEKGLFTLDSCISLMNKKGRVRDITESVIMKTLEATPFNKFRSKLTDVGAAVIKEFLAGGGDVNTGFKIVSFSLGNMDIRSGEEPSSRPSGNGERFGGALRGYGTSLGTLLGNSNTPTTPQSTNDATDVISMIENATVEVWVKPFGGGDITSGTGFFINEGGACYLVTNFHVIHKVFEGGKASIRFSENVNKRKDSFIVEIGDVDPINDLALLKIPVELPKGIIPLELADMNTLQRGQTVVSVGHPSEYSFNAIQGIISNPMIEMGVSRMSGVLCSMPAARGHSGGAIVRVKDGKVIGVATKITKPEEMQSNTICTSADAIRFVIRKTKNKKEEE